LDKSPGRAANAGAQMSQAWLIIERFENWEVDAANNFAFFGLSERYRKPAAEIAKGDLMFAYVSSGRSAFADIRIVVEPGFKRLKTQSYDAAFSLSFSTKPVLTLPQSQWLKIKDVADQLELTRERKDYRPLLQTSLRRLSPHDAAMLERKMRDAHAAQSGDHRVTSAKS
jgi:hypothetical protein